MKKNNRGSKSQSQDFPFDAGEFVRNLPNGERPDTETTEEEPRSVEYESLTEGLRDCFDKPLLSDLPEEQINLLRRQKSVLFNVWDSIPAALRKAAAEFEDCKNNPANRDQIEKGFELWEKIRQLDRMEANSPLELESKNRQLAEYHRQLSELSSGAKGRSNSRPQGDKSRSRKDYMAAELEEVLRANSDLTPDEVMQKLGENAGQSGSCIVEYLPTERAANWKDSSGSVSKLTMAMLQKRLSRLRSKPR